MTGLLLAAALAVPGPARAGAPDMAKAPAVGAWKPFKAPPRNRFSLPNGLPVVFIEDHRAPLLTLRLAVRGGTAFSGERGAGLVEAMAELLTEGTLRRTALSVAEAADAAGGRIGAAATPDHVVVSAEGLSEKADDLLALFAEVALEPAFPDEEVALRRANMLSELKVERSEPGWLADTALDRALYGEHPYAIHGPSPDSIAAIDRVSLQRLHRKLFVPQGAVLVAVGDVAPAAFRDKLAAAFAGWLPTTALPIPPLPPPPPRAGRTLAFVERPGSEESVLVMAGLAVGEAHPDHDALLVANMVLGGSPAARLPADLREARGWTYGIGSDLDDRLASGAFTLETSLRADVTRPALDAVLAQLERLRAKPPSPAELEQAKNLLAGRFVRGLETQDGLAEAVLHDDLFGLPDDRLDRFIARIRAVTPEQAQGAARRWIRPEDMAIAVVGGGAVFKALEGAGPLVRVGDDGKPLPAPKP